MIYSQKQQIDGNNGDSGYIYVQGGNLNQVKIEFFKKSKFKNFFGLT